MPMLTGMAALVTGASRTFGRASASALAEAGVQAFVHYSRSAAEATDVATSPRTLLSRA